MKKHTKEHKNKPLIYMFQVTDHLYYPCPVCPNGCKSPPEVIAEGRPSKDTALVWCVECKVGALALGDTG
jgi:hypothetical protein